MAGKGLKKLLLAASVCLAVILCVLAAFALVRQNTGNAETAAPSEEYAFYAQMERAQVSAWFFQERGVELSSDKASWERSYSGDVPAQVLNGCVEERVGHDKALRTMAARYGTQPMPSFEEMCVQLEAFNQQRQKTVDTGGVVYGPVQYELLEYYLTLRSDAETTLVEAILDDALRSKEKLLRERYEATATEELTRRSIARLMLYVINPEEFAAHSAEAEQAQSTVLMALEQDGETPLEELNALAGMPIGSDELLLDSGTLSKEDDFSARLLAQAAEYDEGDCFIAPLSAGSEYTCIYRVMEWGAGERPSFEEARITVAAQYANEVFERELADLKSDLPHSGR